MTWVGDGQMRPAWLKKSYPDATIRTRVGSLETMHDAARRGLAIAQLPCVLGDLDPDLVRLPARFVEPGWGLWILTHVDIRRAVRMRLFRDHMLEHLNGHRDVIEGTQSRRR